MFEFRCAVTLVGRQYALTTIFAIHLRTEQVSNNLLPPDDPRSAGTHAPGAKVPLRSPGLPRPASEQGSPCPSVWIAAHQHLRGLGSVVPVADRSPAWSKRLRPRPFCCHSQIQPRDRSARLHRYHRTLSPRALSLVRQRPRYRNYRFCPAHTAWERWMGSASYVRRATSGTMRTAGPKMGAARYLAVPRLQTQPRPLPRRAPW